MALNTAGIPHLQSRRLFIIDGKVYEALKDNKTRKHMALKITVGEIHKQHGSTPPIKNILRTMQRVLSAASKDKKPPFSQNGLTIPERDKLKTKIDNRQKVAFSWDQAFQIVEEVQKLENLRAARKEQYSALLLMASASGLRCSELLALRVNDIDFNASSVRVDESSDQRTAGKIGPCKNATAYRTVLLHDSEGQQALTVLRRFIKADAAPDRLIFRSKKNGPLRETTILNQCLHPALDALKFEHAGLHAFRAGCNRRWELAGLAPAVIRQQMGHTSAAMTARYTGEIPLDQVKAEFSSKFGNKIDVLENNGKQKSALIAA
jgi:integrase